MTDTPPPSPAGSGVPGGAGCDAPLEVSDLTAADVVEALGSSCATVDRAEADKLALVVHYVDLHPVTDRRPAAGWSLNDGVGDTELLHARQETPLAGSGTPGIADYALEALGPVLGMGYRATKAYVAGAVELRFRLPRLWELVQAGGCRPGGRCGWPTPPARSRPRSPGSWTGTSPSWPAAIGSPAPASSATWSPRRWPGSTPTRSAGSRGPPPPTATCGSTTTPAPACPS